MKRLILNIDDNVTDIAAIAATMAIVQEGKISKTANGDQYCFHSITNSGVEISITKRKSGTETFFIRKAISRDRCTDEANTAMMEEEQ